jgi:hypothetical protein
MRRLPVIALVSALNEGSEYKRIASNVLSSRLKLLCEEGVLERLPDDQRPGRPKYSLTEKGRELAPVLITLMKWGDRHYPPPGGPPRLTLHAGCGGQVHDDLRCERCGQRPGRDELELPPGPGLSPTMRARSS